MRDHEIAELINQVRDVAKEFGQTQQLRERLAAILVPKFKELQRLKVGVADIVKTVKPLSNFDAYQVLNMSPHQLINHVNDLVAAREHINNQGYEDEIFEIEE